MKVMIILAIFVLTFCFFGCATMQTIQESDQNYSEVDQKYVRNRGNCKFSTPHIYGGAVVAVEHILFPIMCPCSGESGLAFLAFYPFFLPFFIIDLPLSIAADTIILPYTTYKQIKYGNVDIGCDEYYESMGIKR